MGRPGEFYDQDANGDGSGASRGPQDADGGLFYDQDAPIETRPEARTSREQRAWERQRERELELKREVEFERERAARRQRVREQQRADVAAARLRISSRPGDKPVQVLLDPAPVAASPAPTEARPPPPEVAAPAPPEVAAPPPPEVTAPPPPEVAAPPVPAAAVPAPAVPQPPVQAPPDRPRPAAPPRPAPPDHATPAAPPGPLPPTEPPAALLSPLPPAAGPHAADRSGAQPAPNRPPTSVPSTERATTILAAGTFVSRLTGFVRVLAVGYVLGISPISDAYNYANGIPNIIYDLLLGGVLSATLVPVFVDQFRTRDRDETMRAVSAVASAVVVALVVISGLLWLAAPAVIHFYLLLYPAKAAGATRALATQLLHYFAPQVFFLGAIVVSTAMLNARRNFTAAAFSPVLNNLIAIGALLATKAIASGTLSLKDTNPTTLVNRFAQDRHAIWVLGIGTTLGYLVQFLAQVPAMRRVGYRVRLVWDLRHPAVRRVASLSVWVVGVVVANQLSLALVMVLAGREYGGVTAYQFAYQFFQLPYALIAVSIASALMPDLAERWGEGDRVGFERRFIIGFRTTMALLVPIAFVYVAVAQPFIHLAVEHGLVTGSGAHLLGSTLALFAIGLPGFSAFFLLMRLYQAMQNTRTMFWLYALENALTLVAAVALDQAFGVPGLALAWVAPYTVVSFVAARDLRRRVGPLGGVFTARSLVRILIAGGVTAGVVAAVGLLFPSSGSDPVLVFRLIVQLGIGVAVYLGAARVLGIDELKPVIRLVRRFSPGGRFSLGN